MARITFIGPVPPIRSGIAQTAGTSPRPWHATKT